MLTDMPSEKDKHGFLIWNDADQSRMWDEHITIAQHLLRSVIPMDHDGLDMKKTIPLTEGEVLLAYKYGGVLSSRGGYIVINKENPTRIVRSIMTWLS